MSKFEEAINRMFNRVFICRNCKAKLRTDRVKIVNGEAICKKCGSRNFRPIKSKK